MQREAEVGRDNRKMEQPEYVSLEFGELPRVDGGGGWRIAILYLYSFINLISLFSRECIKVSDFIEGLESSTT